MFLRRKGTSWSEILLRDELLHAGIRHSRTPMTEDCPADLRPDLPHLPALVDDGRAEQPQPTR